MRYVSRRLALLAAASCLVALPALSAGPAAVTEADLARVVGDDWTGELTYRDYSPPFGKVAIAAEVDVTRTAAGLTLSMQYPREPQANSSDDLNIADAGRTLGGDPVIAREDIAGAAVITTRAPCEDDGREAVCERIYTFGDKTLSLRKTVRLTGETEAFERNSFVFTR